jgi:hypothetical protein
MVDHAAMDAQKEYDIIEVTSPNGENKRNIGMVAVLSNDPKLYDHFPAPGAFGGATIDDPWETLTKFQTLLEGPEHNVDLILPLQHMYVPDDHRTCREFDFPVVMSGHDHHRVDEVVEGTRLLKPGMDAIYATVLEMTWPDANAEGKQPEILSTFVKTSDYTPDPVLAEENERAYDALLPLRNTQLAQVPPNFKPLTSANSRGTVCTMGSYVCTLLRASLNSNRKKEEFSIDAVLLMGGNIRGGTDYPEDSFFALETLEAEIKADETIAVILMPGWLLAKGVAETHAGGPIPGWIQFDVGVIEEKIDGRAVVTQIRGRPIDPDRFYRIATKISDLTNGQSPSWTEYYNKHPELFPPQGAYVNIQYELLGYFARILWRGVWEGVGRELEAACVEGESCNCDDPRVRLDFLDDDNDGALSVKEIQGALNKMLGLSVHDEELKLARFVHSYADTDCSGSVTIRDFRVFSEEMGEDYSDTWRQKFPIRDVVLQP